MSGLCLKPPEKVRILQRKLYLMAKFDGTRCIRKACVGFVDRLTLSSFVCSEVNPVGKPCAGDPHARFDERGWETELWRGLRHRLIAKAAGNGYSLSLSPTATAPILDSTIRLILSGLGQSVSIRTDLLIF